MYTLEKIKNKKIPLPYVYYIKVVWTRELVVWKVHPPEEPPLNKWLYLEGVDL